MSEYEFLVPELEWKLMRHQRQEQTEATEFDHNQNQNRNHQRDANNRNGSSQSQVQEQQQHQQQEHCSNSFHPNHNSSVAIPMSMKNIYQIEELTWENGQLAMHGHGSSILPAAAQPSTIWSSRDTLESIVHQASSSSLKHARFQADDNIVPMKNPVINPTWANKGSSSGELKPDGIVQRNSSRTKSENAVPVLKKQARSESAPFGTVTNNLLSTSCSYRTDRDERRTKNMDRSMCGSASAPFYREDHDPTMVTWASFESPWSFKVNRSPDEDSAASLGGSENQDEDQETKTENGRCHSSKRSRAAAVHNQSERRRRDRINQKMKTLQRLVPNARKTDKASMLDEVINYLKQLQAQVQMMNTMRNININSLPQMTMMPIGMTPQQQLQMSLLSQMSAGGVGFGLGMRVGVIDINSMARVPAQQQALSPLLHPASAAAAAATAFASTPQLMVPPAHAASSAQASSDAGNNASFHLPDPYCALLAQKMNMELYDKMAALYRRQTTSPACNTNDAKRD